MWQSVSSFENNEIEILMKQASFTLEFTTHVLANSLSYQSKSDTDVFQRDSTGRMIWQQNWWYSAFAQSIALANIRGIKPSDIHMDLVVDAPVKVYERKYVDRKPKPHSDRIYMPKEYGLPSGGDRYRKHEAIFPGAQIKFSAVVADHVTQSQLNTILTMMGKFVGLSPYGYKLGYGKFNLMDCAVDPSESAQLNK